MDNGVEEMAPLANAGLYLGEDIDGRGTQCSECGARDREQLGRHGNDQQHQSNSHRTYLARRATMAKSGEADDGGGREQWQESPGIHGAEG